MINDIPEFETPYHLINIEQLEHNLLILQNLKTHTNCKILYALKAFSNNLLFKYIQPYLDGICASGFYEAKLEKSFSKKKYILFRLYIKILKSRIYLYVAISLSLTHFHNGKNIIK